MILHGVPLACEPSTRIISKQSSDTLIRIVPLIVLVGLNVGRDPIAHLQKNKTSSLAFS